MKENASTHCDTRACAGGRAGRPLVAGGAVPLVAAAALGLSAAEAAACALLVGGTTHGLIRAAGIAGVALPRNLYSRSARYGLPLGLGLAAACGGAKLGVAEAIRSLEEERLEQ